MDQETDEKQQPSVVTIATGVALGVLAAVLIVWFAYGQISANNERDCAFDNLSRALDGYSARDC